MWKKWFRNRNRIKGNGYEKVLIDLKREVVEVPCVE